MSNQAADQSLFWDLLSHQPPLQQSLARVSVGSLVHRLDAARTGRFTSAVRGAFDRWVRAAGAATGTQASARADELTAANAALELRVTKLKTLLARMHQASQRHSEESTAVKRVQKEAAREIQSVKSKDLSEKRVLELQLRSLEIDAAFKEDVEISIQRAAQAMAEAAYSTKSSTSKYHQSGRDGGGREEGEESPLSLSGLGRQGSRSSLLDEASDDPSVAGADYVGAAVSEQLAAQLAVHALQVDSLRAEIGSLQHAAAAHKKSAEALATELAGERQRAAGLRAQVADETCLVSIAQHSIA
jgi:hypothetical protein